MLTPSLRPADRIAKRRGLLNDEPTIRPTATVVALVLAKLERRLELPVLLEDRLGLDHPLEHRRALALELAVLAGGIPIIAGAGDRALDGRSHFMKRAGDRAGDVERGAANRSNVLRRDQRQREQDEADDDPGDDREEAEEQPVLRSTRPAGTRGRHRLGPR